MNNPVFENLKEEVLAKEYGSVLQDCATYEKRISMIKEYISTRKLGAESLMLCFHDMNKYQEALDECNEKRREVENRISLKIFADAMSAI